MMSLPKTWTTKEGSTLNIKEMATPHLLATIHMIERTRMNNLMAIATVDCGQNTIDYYTKFPDIYIALCNEAERRMLIHRGTQKEGLIRSKKK